MVVRIKELREYSERDWSIEGLMAAIWIPRMDYGLNLRTSATTSTISTTFSSSSRLP